MAIDYKLLGSRLKSARIKTGYTQEKVAEIINVSTTYISRIENGTTHINLPRLDELCTLFNTTMVYALSGVSENSNDYLEPEFCELLKDSSPDEKVKAYQIIKIAFDKKE